MAKKKKSAPTPPNERKELERQLRLSPAYMDLLDADCLLATLNSALYQDHEETACYYRPHIQTVRDKLQQAWEALESCGYSGISATAKKELEQLLAKMEVDNAQG